MSHWLLDRIQDRRSSAVKAAEKVQIYREITDLPSNADFELIQSTASTLELAALDLILSRTEENDEQLDLMRGCAADAFRLYRVIPLPQEPLESAKQLLRTCALAVLGDMGADAARLLRQRSWQNLPFTSENWSERTWATILDVWLRLIRKKGWEDRDAVLERIKDLRTSQAAYEKQYLVGLPPTQAKATALELIGLYHLAKAAEILALFITDGVVDGNFLIHTQLEAHFDRVFDTCTLAQLVDLEPLARLLAACANQMSDNSIWTVTRAVNSRVTAFVKTLVDKGRGDRAIFDVLPPQRRTLSEQGLLGSSRRAVVVSLPTSSGKTLIAQFRILQALNQFEPDRGWVAYLAPTRALVNQVTRQLRRDFSPMKIAVEQVSPALELDGIEREILADNDKDQQFRVLVTTPEKLNLMLRQGWEGKIGRPLTLVIVDEAHNIEEPHRGLRLELLLATINKECAKAQFLLLTPFIKNAREVARWLGGQNSDDVSMSLDWQPNDRVIGIAHVEKGEALDRRSFDYSLGLETVHTSRKTLTTGEILPLPKFPEIAATFSKATDLGNLTALVAQKLQERGPVIVMHSTPRNVWSLAEKLKIEQNRYQSLSPEVKLVQDYVKLVFGKDFPLVDLLNHGIGVHHGGLPDDVRTITEWLFEGGKLKFLAATTTVAQGVNFPVSGVVMASHQYAYGADMPMTDFWNIAGRAGRISQGQLGVVALAADSKEKADSLRTYVQKNTADLNSALIQLVHEAKREIEDLGAIVYKRPEWSAFVQYLSHTYLQMGRPESFVAEVEQTLRGTLGFEKLRNQNPEGARSLLYGINAYCEYLQRPHQPLQLVDSTGFSLQSVNTVLRNNGGINERSWNEATLFNRESPTLQTMMGVLLRVPELRENLEEATGGKAPDGKKLASIIKDWVNGESVTKIANKYFKKDLTKCGQNLFGKLTQTASWGLGALLAMTAGELSDERYKELSNLPSRVFYGVNTDAAITLRLLGVPRSAATALTKVIPAGPKTPLPETRRRLTALSEADWKTALGTAGGVYRKIWRTLEGLDS